MSTRILLLIALCLSPLPAQPWKVARAIDVTPVWSGHPVGFDLLTHGNRQFIAFYDAERHMTIGVRMLDQDRWTFARLPSELVWDSHNYVTLDVDRDGYLHVSGNMHAVPLVYFRSRRPFDITSFERVPQMIGSQESRCTYPSFLRGPSGELVFTYRDGGSSNGNQIYNVYDEKMRTWRRLLDAPLTDGQGRMNAYFEGPVRAPDGYFHLAWVWRDTPDCSTNHDLSYARSRDLVHWETSDGGPLTLPIRLGSAEVIDAVPVRGGLLDDNTRLGFDGRGRTILAYQKYDRAGNTQIYLTRREAGRWKSVQLTDWKYRWEFQGRGTIQNEILIGAPRARRDGRLLLDYRHSKYGAGTWIIDAKSFKVVGTAVNEDTWPAELNKVESGFPGVEVRTATDRGTSPDNVRYVLRWETLGTNRDRPRQPPLPEPSMLRLYELHR